MRNRLILGVGGLVTSGFLLGITAPVASAAPTPGSPQDLCNYLKAHPNADGGDWLTDRQAKGDTELQTQAVLKQAYKICPAELKRVAPDVDWDAQ
jgi:hypothetical protein